ACSLPFDTAIFRHLKYDIGSDLWFEAVKNKKISMDEYFVPADSDRDLGNFTEEEINKYIKKASTRFYIRPNHIFGQIYRAFLQKDNNRLKNILKIAMSYRWRSILDHG
ncbi:MAG: radical SAM protein, partial [Thermoplasmatales archaeon]|nr:radical SAM protein [Thermoplasmatales archaeon]